MVSADPACTSADDEDSACCAFSTERPGVLGRRANPDVSRNVVASTDGPRLCFVCPLGDGESNLVRRAWDVEFGDRGAEPEPGVDTTGCVDWPAGDGGTVRSGKLIVGSGDSERVTLLVICVPGSFLPI